MGNTKSLGIAYTDQDIDGGTIGASTAAPGTFTDLTATGDSALGSAVTDKVGFYGVTGIVQPADAAQAALTLTTATTTGIGFSTVTAFNAFSAQLENIRAELVLLGLLKGAA